VKVSRPRQLAQMESSVHRIEFRNEWRHRIVLARHEYRKFRADA